MFVGFYALASIRALIPGLCATQEALACHVEVVQHGCCAADSAGRPGRVLVSNEAEHPQCPFCHLIHAPTQPMISGPALSGLETSEVCFLPYSAVVPRVDAWDPTSPRAPPVLA